MRNSRKNLLYIITGLFILFFAGSVRGQTSAGTAIPNTAYGHYDDGSGVTQTTPSDTVVTIVGEGTLYVTKAVNLTQAEPGDTLLYTIRVQNVDSSPTFDVTVLDSLERMLSYIGSNPSGVHNDNVIQWHFPQINPGETITLHISCQITNTAYKDTIENVAIYSTSRDIRLYSNKVYTAWDPWPEADLEKTVSPKQVYAGDTLTYQLRVRNTGPMPLSNVRVRDPLPEGIEYIGTNAAMSVSNRTLTWVVGGLNPNMEVQGTFRAIVLSNADNTILNKACLSSAQGAEDSSQAVSEFLGQGVQITITKEAPDSIYVAGDTLTYSLVLGNAGVRTAYNVVVRDTLPSELMFIGSSGGQQTGDMITWNRDKLEAGEFDTLQLTAAIRMPVEDRTMIINRARAYSVEGSVDSSRWQIRVISRPDIDLSKKVNQTVCYIGDTLTYTLQLQNTGHMVLTNIVAQDTLPEGTTFIASSLPVDTTNHILTWEVDSLNIFENISLQYKLRIESYTAENLLKNSAFVVTDENAQDSAAVSIPFRGHGIGLEIIKEADTTTYTAGDTVAYDIILRNGGVRFGHHVIVRDTIPEELKFIEATHDVQNMPGGILLWQFDDLHTGFTDTIRAKFVIRIPIENMTKVDNVVWANASYGAQDSSHWEITVLSDPVFELDISGPSEAAPGDTICYDLIFANVGTATAFEPVLVDTLPDLLKYVNTSIPCVLSSDSQTVEWHLPPLAPGESDTLTLCVSISEEVQVSDEIINVAWLSDRTAIRVSIVIASCLTSTNIGGPGYYTYKTVNRHTASRGDTLTYTIYFNRYQEQIPDTVLIVDVLPAEVQWIPEIIFAKSSNQQITFDPLTNELRIARNEWCLSGEDSIVFDVIVSADVSPGIKIIENEAFVMCGEDTLSTKDDPRSDAVTRLVEPFLKVKKTVNHKTSEIGDILTYTVTIENRSEDDPVCPIHVNDLLPRGFRYLEKTSTLDTLKINDPLLGNFGKQMHMQWILQDTLAPGRSIQLKYRVVISLSAPMGESENRVSATADAGYGIWISSNVATAAVIVRAGILDDRGFIFGKVYTDQNQNGLHDNSESGIKDVELILEDGTRVKTDAYGKYSIPNVEHGQHVLRLNESTLPEGSKIISKGPRFMGNSSSQIVRLMPGGMAKANFAVEEKRQ